MRFTDFFYVLPTLVLALVVAAVMGPSLANVIIVIAITSWPATARVIRSQTLTIRERMFVDRARASGAGSLRIMRKQVLPNVFGLVLANTTLTIASAIFLETTLSFLGVGPRDTWSWGRIWRSRSRPVRSPWDCGAGSHHRVSPSSSWCWRSRSSAPRSTVSSTPACDSGSGAPETPNDPT